MSEKKQSSTSAGVPRGDKRSGLRKVPIRLCYSSDEDSDYDSEAEGNHVTIKVKIDPNVKDDKSNLTSKRFRVLKTLMGSGREFVLIYRKLMLDYFKPEGKHTAMHAGFRLIALQRVFQGEALQKYMKILNEVKEEYCTRALETHPVEAAGISQKSYHDFFVFMKTFRLMDEGDDEDEYFNEEKDAWASQKTIQKDENKKGWLERIREDHVNFERKVMYAIGENIWSPNHRGVWKRQYEYLMFQTQKPYGWSMSQYVNRHEELNEVMRYMQPPSRRGEAALDADWKQRDDGISEFGFRDCVLNGLPERMQNQIRRRVASDKDISSISRIEFQDILLEVEEDDVLEQEKLRKAKKESAATKRKAEKGSEDRGWSKRAKGKARRANLICNYCKKKGLPEKVYTTHIESNCRVKKRETQEKLAGSSQKELNDAMAKIKIDHKKAIRKMYKLSNKKNREFKALRAFLKAGGEKEKKAFRKFAKDFKANSDSDESHVSSGSSCSISDFGDSSDSDSDNE